MGEDKKFSTGAVHLLSPQRYNTKTNQLLVIFCEKKNTTIEDIGGFQPAHLLSMDGSQEEEAAVGKDDPDHQFDQ